MGRTTRVAGAVLATLILLAAPADAHPFGPPQTARASVHDNRVDIAWHAAEDDWVVLGEQLGAFAGAGATGQDKLERSPKVQAYLLDTVRVKQADEPCRGRVVDLTALLDRGAKLRYDCPKRVTEVDITIEALSELNPAYRTVLTAEPATPRQTLFDAANRTHRVTFSPATRGDRLPVVQIAAAVVVGVGVVLVSAVVSVRRRRRRRTGVGTAT